MTKWLVFVILFVVFSPFHAFTQDSLKFDFKNSYGTTASFAPNSHHIFIGESEGRSITTSGFEFTHRIFEKFGVKFDYVANIEPYYRESDPTASQMVETFNGKVYFSYTANPGIRTIVNPNGFGGYDCSSLPPLCLSIYNTPGPSEITYGFATTPLGVRAVMLPHHRIQPTFAANTGYVITERAIPIDGAAFVNYQLSLGPGIQVFTSKNTSLRGEYLFRHISNGGSSIDPGIDQGVFRITFSYHR